jgi:hypothetical protein
VAAISKINNVAWAAIANVGGVAKASVGKIGGTDAPSALHNSSSRRVR